MSFASEMKNELCEGGRSRACCRFSELAGMILATAVIDSDQLRMYTENEHVAQRICDLFYEVFKMGSETIGKSSQNTVYKVLVRGKENIQRIQREVLYLDPDKNLPRFCVHDALFKKECCIRSFLKGVFLAAGFLADPNKNYHFEIVTRHKGLSLDIIRLFSKYDIHAKETLRKSNHVVYIKESEAIADAINVIGAHHTLMEFRNIQVLKDVRNQVNRSVNCETANVMKTANAAYNQVKNIRLIEKRMGLSNLPDDLQEVARLRLKNREASLLEIAKKLSVPISKSGVNHRFLKIEKIARDLK